MLPVYSSLHGTPKLIRGAPLMNGCKFQKYRAAVWDGHRGCRGQVSVPRETLAGSPLPVSGGNAIGGYLCSTEIAPLA